jgi:hypothetical protein
MVTVALAGRIKASSTRLVGCVAWPYKNKFIMSCAVGNVIEAFLAKFIYRYGNPLPQLVTATCALTLEVFD